MNAGEVSSLLLYKLRSLFGGVLASNQLPLKIKRPVLFVVNTDPSQKSGKHWTVFWFPKRGQAEFFDSYGRSPSKVHHKFASFLKRHSRKYLYNRKRLQANGSNTCGPYCIYYAIHRTKGISLKTITHQFTKDWNENDRLIRRWISRLYK